MDVTLPLGGLEEDAESQSINLKSPILIEAYCTQAEDWQNHFYCSIVFFKVYRESVLDEYSKDS